MVINNNNTSKTKDRKKDWEHKSKPITNLEPESLEPVAESYEIRFNHDYYNTPDNYIDNLIKKELDKLNRNLELEFDLNQSNNPNESNL